MTPPGFDEQAAIDHQEARQELYGGRGPSKAGMATFEIVAIIVAMIGAAVAFEEIDHWSQWVVLGAIIVTLIGVMVALNPDRRG